MPQSCADGVIGGHQSEERRVQLESGMFLKTLKRPLPVCHVLTKCIIITIIEVMIKNFNLSRITIEMVVYAPAIYTHKYIF